MRVNLILLSILTLLMITGAIPVNNGSQTAIFRTPVFILTVAILAISLIVCSFQHRRWRKFSFLICHLGIVLIIIGALARFAWGEKYEVTIPVTRNHRALNLKMPDGTIRPLGFGLSVTEFSVEFYNPTYQLLNDNKVLDEFSVTNSDFLKLGEHGQLAISKLKLPGVHGWKPQYTLPNGLQLKCQPPTPRHYEAELEFSMPDNTADQETLAINHPVFHKGWWFHLLSYDAHEGQYIIVSIKRDPGLRIAMGGIWMTLLGTAGLCLKRRKQ